MAGWRQFQSNAANQGYIPITTGLVNSLKWRVEVGPVSFAAPVIGNDGTVYIGNLLSELVAMAPDGTIRWKRALDQRGSFISGTPAIDANGNIYAITTYRATERDHRSGETIVTKVARSKLHSLSPDGSLRWTFSFPTSVDPYAKGGYSLSSPKISGQRNPLIFVRAIFTKIASRTEILVINSLGELVHRSQVSDYPTPSVTTGNDVYDILNSIWDFLNGMEFEPRGGPALEKQFGWPEPTLAVADFGAHASEPIVVIDDHYKKLAAFRWSNQRLNLLWEKNTTQARPSATPAILLSSMVAIGQHDGTLALYDLLTGQELWKPWYKAPKRIQSAPASFLSQIYSQALLYLTALDANAKFLNQNVLNMVTLGSPAISADRIFLNGGDGYYTFSIDLKEVTKNSEFQGGVSSPAIAEDGTVYVIDRNKMLWAFGKENRKRPRVVR